MAAGAVGRLPKVVLKRMMHRIRVTMKNLFSFRSMELHLDNLVGELHFDMIGTINTFQKHSEYVILTG